MTPDRFAAVADLFDRLRDLSADERAAALDLAADIDGDIRDAAASLLRHDSPTGAFLGRPALAATAELLAPLSGFSVPERIGGYRILDRLGQGGFATVYLAEQASPRRQVALKLIRPGASADELRRFVFEAEALARLDHPGIASVYECGVADIAAGAAETGGAAYIAMEYVDGLPLDEHIRGSAPARDQRLALLAALTDAIEHAHIRGVIHRDLAPKNILVRADGTLKVIDFGLARELRQRDPASLAVTIPGSVLGTLRYMSPEQLSGSAAAADTRADLYALGVIAYEALLGAHPYLNGDEPLGTAVRLLQEGRARRATEADPHAGRELEAVLLAAVERNPDRRYQTAGLFAADLRSLAADRPVSVRASSHAYRAVKFCRRNRWRIGAAAAVILAAGGAATSVLHAKGRQEESRVAAANAIEVLVERLLSPLAPRIGTLADREELLVAVSADLDRFRTISPNDPRTLRIYGGYVGLLADVHRERGRFVEAHAAYTRAADTLRALAATREATFEDGLRLSLALVKLGDTEFTLDNGERTRALYNEALDIDKANAAAAPTDPRAMSNLFWSHLRIAGLEWDQASPVKIQHRTLASDLARRMVETAPESWRSWEALAQSAIADAVALNHAERDAEARDATMTAVNAATRLVALDPRVAVHHATLMDACQIAAARALRDGEIAQAESLMERAEVSAAALSASEEDPYVVYAYTSRLGATRADLAGARGDLAGAVQHLTRRLAIIDERLASVPSDETAFGQWVATQDQRIALLKRLGRHDEATATVRTLHARAASLDGTSPTIRAAVERALSVKE